MGVTAEILEHILGAAEGWLGVTLTGTDLKGKKYINTLVFDKQ